jgi:hypothetical protein
MTLQTIDPDAVHYAELAQRYREALEAILRHYEATTPRSVYKLSAVWNIAKRALPSEDSNV